MKVLYTASSTATGDGRNGHVRSSDGVIDVDLAVPTSMGGPGGPHPNPELLFASGYAACFHGALKLVAARDKVAISDTAITADVSIGPNETGGFQLAVQLHVELSGIDQAAAEKLVEAAHQVCPYSNAIRGNVPTTVTAVAA